MVDKLVQASVCCLFVEKVVVICQRFVSILADMVGVWLSGPSSSLPHLSASSSWLSNVSLVCL